MVRNQDEQLASLQMMYTFVACSKGQSTNQVIVFTTYLRNRRQIIIYFLNNV